MHPCLDRGFFVRKSSFYVYLFFEKAPPIIAVSPPPTVSASVGQIFIINSTTLGVPTPEIVCIWIGDVFWKNAPWAVHLKMETILLVNYSLCIFQEHIPNSNARQFQELEQLIMNFWNSKALYVFVQGGPYVSERFCEAV